MVIIIDKKANKEQITKMLEDFDSYIKVVIDIDKGILAAGGDRHFDAEQTLLENGSKQSSLWGGGIDWETKEIDYNSIINLRPKQENPSRDILNTDIRAKFDKIIITFLL